MAKKDIETKLEVTNCDLKRGRDFFEVTFCYLKRKRRQPLSALCLHSQWHRDAQQCIKV